MVSLRSFLFAVQSIVDEKPTYALGMDGSSGACDCIGLVIGAVRRAGGKWTGAHGSNWAARNAIAEMHHDHRYELGWCVFKARSTGLPAAYASDPDQRNYYHAGVVTSVNPLRITHCTSTSGKGGIKVDTVPGAWEHSGRLTDVNYDEEADETLEAAVVTAESGRSVNLRKSPTTASVVIERVPVGTLVYVTSRDSEWSAVQHGPKTGYMMSKHLVPEEPEDTENPVELTARELAAQVYELIKQHLQG